jgi:hypothetical protein
MSRRDAITWFVEHVESSSCTNEEMTLVLQDVWAKPNDPTAQRSAHRRFFTDSDVYYFFDSKNLISGEVQNAISSMASYLFIAFLSRFALRSSELPPDHIVDDNLIEQLAHNIQEVFVGAYDQEGLVMWRRR